MPPCQTAALLPGAAITVKSRTGRPTLPDEKPHAPAGRGKRRYRLTPDRVLLGPPLGGALCFVYQAVSVYRDPAGTADLASLFAALVIGTAAGAVVEGLVRFAFPGRAGQPAKDTGCETTPASDRERTE